MTPLPFATQLTVPSLMSDYEVTLVNNKMSEFFVKFKGPAESESDHWSGLLACSTRTGVAACQGLD